MYRIAQIQWCIIPIELLILCSFNEVSPATEAASLSEVECNMRLRSVTNNFSLHLSLIAASLLGGNGYTSMGLIGVVNGINGVHVARYCQHW